MQIQAVPILSNGSFPICSIYQVSYLGHHGPFVSDYKGNPLAKIYFQVFLTQHLSTETAIFVPLTPSEMHVRQGL